MRCLVQAGSPLSTSISTQPPKVPRGPLDPASLPFQAQATCPRIYTNALSNRCPCRALPIDLRWGPQGAPTQPSCPAELSPPRLRTSEKATSSWCVWGTFPCQPPVRRLFVLKGKTLKASDSFPPDQELEGGAAQNRNGRWTLPEAKMEENSRNCEDGLSWKQEQWTAQ